MKTTTVTTGKALSVLALILSLSAMPLLLGLTGCATSSRSEQSNSQRVDDQATSSRVKAALGDDTQYKYGAVNVETFKGTVQLSGFVNSRDQKNRAGNLAEKVSGVKQVANNITVQESAN